MPLIALISDIHANLEALAAVFADIDRQPGVAAVYCLGDLVGYGPDPEAVVDLVRQRCADTLMGNHDYALLHEPVGFNPIAAGAILCQRSLMDPRLHPDAEKQMRWDFLAGLKPELWLNDDLLVHASPRDKMFEYILAEDTIYNRRKLEAIFATLRRHCYIGHTHRPGVITADLRWHSDRDLNYEYRFQGDAKVIINISSVGQPRDRDPRACYALVDDERIRWRRVIYDVEMTARKVADCPCLDSACGERLRYGK